MERYEIVADDEGKYCGLIPSENGSVVKYADAQTTVEALQRERDELREATKVICGHCCEPMAIPSKAILRARLSALQALVRALLDSNEKTYTVAYHNLYHYSQRAALDATTPAPMGSNILEEDIGKAMMRSKGGDGE